MLYAEKILLTFIIKIYMNTKLYGALDYYGKLFFRKNLFEFDYINSGVLLLNLGKIRETGLFQKCRERCQTKKMFMPDQSAINKLVTSKKIVPRKYNEQKKLQEDTVFQHFTTGFKFFPWIRIVTIKPWQIDELHNKLKIYEYDDILEVYTNEFKKWKQEREKVNANV